MGNGILIVGGVSLDVLHLPDGRTVEVPGGAGLYTALGAAAAGARVTLLAPRPEPLPAPLASIPRYLTWRGPAIAPARLMRLEIAHHGGGRATLLNADWGAVAEMLPAALPPALRAWSSVHVAALGAAARQLEFLTAARARGARVISAGTYARAVSGETETVRALWAQADLFFLNENEAQGLFGSAAAARARPGGRLFITLGERGALVAEAAQTMLVPGQPQPEVDPTGAGDVFCGAVLAGLARGLDALAAAAAAMPLAARQVTAVGPAALLAPRGAEPD